MWYAIKQMDFCYGHRLLDYEGRCAHPHGHNGRVEIVCAAETLNGCGMVVDFGDIKSIVRDFIEENWDHKMLLRRDDPLVEELAARGEPLFLMDENPTAEALARFLHDYARRQGLPVVEVRFHETPTSIAVYRETPRP